MAEHVARKVAELGEEASLVGATDPAGYSHVHAVIGATLPEQQVRRFRQLMPRAILLLPGYGSQGGTARSAAAGFDANGLGAVVSASRSLTYFGYEADHAAQAAEATKLMRDELNSQL